MPLRLFRSRNVTGANLVMALLVVGFFGMFFLGALYMQDILGYSPLEVGLAFLPACFVMGTLSLGFAERLIMGVGPRSTLVAGLVAAGAGLLLFARAPVDGVYAVDILPVMLLLGTGAGPVLPGADDTRDVGCHRQRRRPGLGSRQHDGAGRRGDRPGRTGHACDRAHRRPARRRGGARLRAQLGLPPGLPDRRGADRGGRRGRARSAARGAPRRRRKPRRDAAAPSLPTTSPRLQLSRRRLPARNAKGDNMGQPVVHFEVVGKDGSALRFVLLRALRMEDRRQQPDELRHRAAR